MKEDFKPYWVVFMFDGMIESTVFETELEMARAIHHYTVCDNTSVIAHAEYDSSQYVY